MCGLPGEDRELTSVTRPGFRRPAALFGKQNGLNMNIARFATLLIICAANYANGTPIVPFRSPTAGTYGRMVPIPAGTRAHYNINNFEGPGTYKFGYDTGSGPRQSFREEERRRDGVVRGRYGYVEPSGALRVVEYRADSTGFHILKTRTMVPDMKPKPAVKVRTPFVGPLPPFIPTSYVVNLAG